MEEKLRVFATERDMVRTTLAPLEIIFEYKDDRSGENTLTIGLSTWFCGKP